MLSDKELRTKAKRLSTYALRWYIAGEDQEKLADAIFRELVIARGPYKKRKKRRDNIGSERDRYGGVTV